MKEDIRHFDQSAEFYTDEMCYINELLNSADDAGLSIALARVSPGITTRWHKFHGISERYVILEGRGLVEIGDLAPKEVNYGDVVVIPPLCRQRIANNGSEDLVFLAICTPRFRQEAYEDIEDFLIKLS